MIEVDCGFDDQHDGVKGAELLSVYGPTLLVSIGFDEDWTFDSDAAPTPAAKNIQALVDTGAAVSCIDDLLATQLNLPCVDEVN